MSTVADNHVHAPGPTTVLYKHVLALNPYFKGSTASMGVFPATGLEYVVASMKDLVGKITFLDLRYDAEYRDSGKLCDFIREEIDLVCITLGWQSGFEPMLDFISRLPPEVMTVIGGHKATEEVELLFERCPNIRVVVRGEAEEIIRELVKGVPFEDIAGLSFRRDGRIVHNKNARLPDVALLPFPDRSLRKHTYRWNQHGVRLTDWTFDTVLTTRGCPFKCKFCTFSLNPLGQKREYTERPLESVIEELKTVSADIVMFSDDNFFTNPVRSEKLCDLIVQNGIKKTFVVQTRIDIARRPSLLEKAANAGIKIMLLGIESPHNRILEQISKGFDQQDIRDAVATLRKYPFYLHAYFIYGNIGETEEEMMYIPTFAKELGLDSITFQKLRIEKYSPLLDVVRNTPGYHCDYVGGPVYSDKYSLADLKRIRNRIRRQFYTPSQLVQIARKLFALQLVDRQDVGRLLLAIPRLSYGLIKREVQKMRLAAAAARKATTRA